MIDGRARNRYTTILKGACLPPPPPPGTMPVHSTLLTYLTLSNVKYLLLLCRDVVLLCRHIFQRVGAERVATEATNRPLLDDIRVMIRCQVAGLRVGEQA